jgi:hypothetical protein
MMDYSIHYRNSALCRVPNILPSVFFSHSTKTITDKMFVEYSLPGFAECKVVFAECLGHSTKNTSLVVIPQTKHAVKV